MVQGITKKGQRVREDGTTDTYNQRNTSLREGIHTGIFHIAILRNWTYCYN